jgi:NADH:ubiquinone oxidoreductase subunit E
MAGMMITCWSEASVELLDKLLQALKIKEQNEEDKGTLGIASSIVYITEKLG